MVTQRAKIRLPRHSWRTIVARNGVIITMVTINSAQGKDGGERPELNNNNTSFGRVVVHGD
jgi:hypothetical protein